MIDMGMIELFSARVCVGHLNRLDDCIQYLMKSLIILSFCSHVLQESQRSEQIVQAYQLTGSALFQQSRESLVFSKRISLLVSFIKQLLLETSYPLFL